MWVFCGGYGQCGICSNLCFNHVCHEYKRLCRCARKALYTIRKKLMSKLFPPEHYSNHWAFLQWTYSSFSVGLLLVSRRPCSRRRLQNHLLRNRNKHEASLVLNISQLLIYEIKSNIPKNIRFNILTHNSLQLLRCQCLPWWRQLVLLEEAPTGCSSEAHIPQVRDTTQELPCETRSPLGMTIAMPTTPLS